MAKRFDAFNVMARNPELIANHVYGIVWVMRLMVTVGDSAVAVFNPADRS